MSPEEKLAKRLLERHRIQPPYNLQELVSKYANLHLCYFPYDVEADGMSVNLKILKKPDIYINSSKPPTRQKFSIAHELGHVLIPWHTGNILSFSNNFQPGSDTFSRLVDEYLQIESEANRFAAELLLPNSWLHLKLSKINFNNFDIVIQNIIQNAGTSRDASLIKIFSILRPGFICFEIDDDNCVIRSFASNDTPAYALHKGEYCSQYSYTKYKNRKYFNLGNKKYVLWEFNYLLSPPRHEDSRSWREILEKILNDTQLHDKRQHINALLGTKTQIIRAKQESEVLSIITHKYFQRNDLLPFIRHPLSQQYMIKRIRELKNK